MEPRDNGLEAERWLPLADIEAPLADHVLQALAEASIAAIAVPTSAGDSTGLAAAWGSAAAGRWTGPSERIDVDGSKRKEARRILDELLPELRAELAEYRQRSEEAAWTQIVATLETPADSDATERDAAEVAATREGDGRAEATSNEEWADLDVPSRPAVPAELADLDDDEHFVPPPAPPVPAADAVTRAAWTGVVGGPLFLVLATLLGWEADGLPALLAVGAFVGGFVTLVARMKDRPPLDESGDDGAVV
jgi:hypothetical protein